MKKTNETCSYDCDLVSPIFEGTHRENWYCQTHKKPFWPHLSNDIPVYQGKSASYRYASPEDFVILWFASDSVAEIADKLGITYEAVSARAGMLRRRGVNLPRKKPGIRGIDAKKLNALVSHLERKAKKAKK